MQNYIIHWPLSDRYDDVTDSTSCRAWSILVSSKRAISRERERERGRERERERCPTTTGIEMSDDNWERATYPLKQGGLAPGTVGNRASAAYLTALIRTMPEVLRRTGYDGIEALRRAAPALDRGITVATADLRDRRVPAEKVPFAHGIGTIEPKQKDIVGVINDKRYEDRLATLDEGGRGQLRSASGSGSAAFLLMLKQQDHRIEDPFFRVAVVGRLAAGSRLRLALTLRVIVLLCLKTGRCVVVHSATGGSM